MNLGCDCEGCCGALVDSGSSLITAPKFVVNLLREKTGFAKYDEDGDGQIDCTDVDADEFRPFAFVLNDEKKTHRNPIALPSKYCNLGWKPFYAMCAPSITKGMKTVLRIGRISHVVWSDTM